MAAKNGARREFDPVFLRLYDESAGWSSQVARWAHNPKVAGSNPAPASELFPRKELRLTRRYPIFSSNLCRTQNFLKLPSFEVNPFVSIGRRCALGILMRHSIL